MCTAAVIYDICSVCSCIVSCMYRKWSPDNFQELDFVTSELAPIRYLYVSNHFCWIRKFWYRTTGTFPYHAFLMYSHQMKIKSITCCWHSFCLMLLENRMCRAVSTESVLCTLHILHMNASADLIVSSVNSPVPILVNRSWWFLKTFHAERFVWLAKYDVVSHPVNAWNSIAVPSRNQ